MRKVALFYTRHIIMVTAAHRTCSKRKLVQSFSFRLATKRAALSLISIPEDILYQQYRFYAERIGYIYKKKKKTL